MPLPRVRVPATDEFHAGFDAIRERLEIPGAFPPEVEAAAAEAARRSVGADRVDRRDLPFVTIDPAGSTDLDQALHLEALGAATGSTTPSPTSPRSWTRAIPSTRSPGDG